MLATCEHKPCLPTCIGFCLCFCTRQVSVVPAENLHAQRPNSGLHVQSCVLWQYCVQYCGSTVCSTVAILWQWEKVWALVKFLHDPMCTPKLTHRRGAEMHGPVQAHNHSAPSLPLPPPPSPPKGSPAPRQAALGVRGEGEGEGGGTSPPPQTQPKTPQTQILKKASISPFFLLTKKECPKQRFRQYSVQYCGSTVFSTVAVQ